MSSTLVSGSLVRGRYRVTNLVGQGGGGAVFRAEDLRLPGRVTAIKEIRPEPHATPEIRGQAQEQFRREASTLARLDHPALPKVSDYFVDRGCDYLVMDFVDGQNLRQVVDDARASGEFLPELRVLRWLDQLMDVVGYLHAQDPPVVHRDIKPANIKLISDDRIKLVDFGLVKPLDPSDPRTLTVARGVGSLPYTPLEQYAGDTGATDIRSDVYGIGATAYHLLTGQPPATAQERFLLPNALKRPRQTNPDISTRTEQAILAALALHPDSRPADVASLADLLTGRATAPPNVDAPVPTLIDEWRTEITSNIGLIALVCLLLLLATLATWQSDRAAAINASGLQDSVPTAQTENP